MVGGIASADDALQYLMVGASAVVIGSSFFSNKNLPDEIFKRINDYANENNISSLKDFNLFKDK